MVYERVPAGQQLLRLRAAALPVAVAAVARGARLRGVQRRDAVGEGWAVYSGQCAVMRCGKLVITPWQQDNGYVIRPTSPLGNQSPVNKNGARLRGVQRRDAVNELGVYTGPHRIGRFRQGVWPHGLGCVFMCAQRCDAVGDGWTLHT